MRLVSDTNTVRISRKLCWKSCCYWNNLYVCLFILNWKKFGMDVLLGIVSKIFDDNSRIKFIGIVPEVFRTCGPKRVSSTVERPRFRWYFFRNETRAFRDASAGHTHTRASARIGKWGTVAIAIRIPLSINLRTLLSAVFFSFYFHEHLNFEKRRIRIS